MIVRAPASAAPIAALIAECSDSTLMISPCTRPAAANFAKPWIIGVCGVIGYTGTTSGSIWRIASATASPPVSTRAATALVAIAHHPDSADGTDDLAKLTALADVVVEADESRPVQPDR